MADRVDILTPVGRLVQGSLYKGSARDIDGNPLTFKSGENVGQPRVNYFLGVAIPKDGRDWKQTEWGQVIFQVGATAHPQAHKARDFAWKVVDGDDATVNIKGKAPHDNEGYPGNWILKFSSSFAPKIFREENGAYVQVTEANYIMPGDYIQVSGTVSANTSTQKPGVYLNHSMVAHSGYGVRINFGPDANSVGFGKAPLPAGAFPTPVASSAPLPASTPPPPPAPPTGPKMTAKAAGSSYQSFKTAGWTDEALIQQGYMTA